MADWADWKIGWNTKDGFKESEWDGRYFYGDMMQLKFNCEHCRKEIITTSTYEPVPLHYESLLRAEKKKPKCKCGALYELNEAEEYELIEIGECINENQLTLF